MRTKRSPNSSSSDFSDSSIRSSPRAAPTATATAARTAGRHRSNDARTCARAFERGSQAFGPDRLDEVIDRGRFEGRQRVCVVGGAEHHRGAWFEGGQMPRGFQPVDAGHRDIQQHEVRMVLRAGMQGFAPVAGFGDQFDAGLFGEQVAQAFPRERFVVGNQHSHDRPPAGSGTRSSAR